MKKILIGLMLSSLTVAASQYQPEDPTACNQDLLVSYGLEGRPHFEYSLLEMCPDVRKNCCLREDQMQIYTNWIHSGEEQKVEQHYHNITQNYTELIEKLIEVQNFTERVVQRLSSKKVANCKILGERILNFDIKTIGPILLQSLNNTIEFWTTSYQGFYCSICDQDNHQFFNTTTNKVVFSEQFCRDITEHTLPTMMYFHNHFVKYLNLITKFVMSCDFKGDFNLDAIVPTNMTFTIDEELKQDLYECRDYRNTKDWFIYCKDYCSNFELTKFSEFFEPNLHLYGHYIEFLERQLEHLEDEELRNPLIANADSVAGGSAPAGAKHKKVKLRLLNEKAHDAEHDNIVFKPAMGARMIVGEMETEFEEDGMNLYQVGERAQISEAIFNQLKTLSNLKKMSKSGQSLTPAQKSLLSNSGTKK